MVTEADLPNFVAPPRAGRMTEVGTDSISMMLAPGIPVPNPAVKWAEIKVLASGWVRICRVDDSSAFILYPPGSIVLLNVRP